MVTHTAIRFSYENYYSIYGELFMSTLKRALSVVLFLMCFSVSASHATLSLDGQVLSSSSCSASPCTVSLTTTKTNDVIIVFAKNFTGSAGGVTGISDTAGLSWAKRTATSATNGTVGNLEEWYAVSTGILSSDTISVAWSGGVFSRISAFGINGANTSLPFDSNVSLPADASSISGSATSLSNTVSTSNANDMLIVALACGNAVNCGATSITEPSGFTQVNGYTGSDTGYNIVSAIQSSVTQTYSWSTAGSQQQLFISDAIVASGGSPKAPSPASNLFFGSGF